MLAKLTTQLKGVTGKQDAKTLKAEAKAELRRVNTEKYAGGRGSTEGIARYEKRNGGRIRTSSLECELGSVADLSPSGLRVHSVKKPKVEKGQTVHLTLKAEDQKLHIKAEVVWVRVDEKCEFDIGLRFCNPDVILRKRVMEIAATAQASDGLSRGWAKLQGY